MLRLHRLVDFRAAAEAAAVLGASAFAALLTGKSADSSDRLTAIVKSAPVPGLTAAQQAAALLTGLIPVAALHTWRALRRRRRRQMQVRRVAARICPLRRRNPFTVASLQTCSSPLQPSHQLSRWLRERPLQHCETCSTRCSELPVLIR